MSTFQRDQKTLEELLDRQGPEVLIGMLNNICDLKAEHLRSNWQDPTSARKWTELSRKLDPIERWAKDF